MERLYYGVILILLFGLSSMQAQITISSSYFPSVGDTISSVSIIPIAGQVPITDSGGNQLWDFSQVGTNGALNTDVYVDAAELDTLDAFPNANLALNGNGAGVTYFSKDDSSFELLGFVGLDPTGFGLNLVTSFQPPLVDRTAPLEFLDLDTYSTAAVVPFGADMLPGGILDSLPFSPDSIRILVELDQVDLVDAWGTVTLPGNTSYEVLRQRRVQMTETRLEVKVPILDWQDVTDLFGAAAGGFLGMDTTITLNYWAEGVSEAVAVITLDDAEENVTGFTYKNSEIITSTESTSVSGFENVYAYPNPAIDYAKFDCVNLKPNYYDLKIFNILGLEAYSERYFISGNKMLKVDLSDFRKGTYLYSLVDTTGKVVTTKRLVVIKP